MKYLFFSGKGGVGKTSMACATALHHARCGEKTLIVTTDPAANLSDVFEQKIGHQIAAIKGVEALYAMEIDPDIATREYIDKTIDPMRDIFDGETLSIVQEQLSGPCTVEMAAFEKFVKFLGENDFDKIIFDTAPTGHTIRLLQLPMEWSKHIEESAQGSGQTCMGPVSMIEDDKRAFDEAMDKMRDPKMTKFIFVLHAEETSITETQRAIMELEPLGLKAGELIINGLIPEEEAVHPFFRAKVQAEKDAIQKVEKVFEGLPIKKMELFDEELKGVAMITKCAERLYGGCV